MNCLWPLCHWWGRNRVAGSISDTQPGSKTSKLCSRLRRELEPVFSIDLRSLALFRISLALLLFAEI